MGFYARLVFLFLMGAVPSTASALTTLEFWAETADTRTDIRVRCCPTGVCSPEELAPVKVIAAGDGALLVTCPRSPGAAARDPDEEGQDSTPSPTPKGAERDDSDSDTAAPSPDTQPSPPTVEEDTSEALVVKPQKRDITAAPYLTSEEIEEVSPRIVGTCPTIEDGYGPDSWVTGPVNDVPKGLICPVGTVPAVLGTTDAHKVGATGQNQLDLDRGIALAPVRDWDGRICMIPATPTASIRHKKTVNSAVFACVKEEAFEPPATNAMLIPGPAGPPGPAGAQGAHGETGESGGGDFSFELGLYARPSLDNILDAGGGQLTLRWETIGGTIVSAQAGIGASNWGYNGLGTLSVSWEVFDLLEVGPAFQLWKDVWRDFVHQAEYQGALGGTLGFRFGGLRLGGFVGYGPNADRDTGETDDQLTVTLTAGWVFGEETED